eukprot:Selendium_serpulae@DN4388_c0_g2_i1.p1
MSCRSKKFASFGEQLRFPFFVKSRQGDYSRIFWFTVSSPALVGHVSLLEVNQSRLCRRRNANWQRGLTLRKGSHINRIEIRPTLSAFGETPNLYNPIANKVPQPKPTEAAAALLSDDEISPTHLHVEHRV